MTEQKSNTLKRSEMKYWDFISDIIHGSQKCYNWLRRLQGAVEFPRNIPKSYIYADGNYTYPEVFEIGNTKTEAQQARNQLIEEIVATILKGKTDRNKKMMPDHYARLFHALAVLKLEKDTNLFPGTTTNYSYNAMYMLWRLDDGSETAYKALENAGWYMAEELKGRNGRRKSECVLGNKC